MLSNGGRRMRVTYALTVAKTMIAPVGFGALKAGVFWLSGEEILHKNVEIFAVGKIAEFARFSGGERRKSPDRFSFHILAEGRDIIEARVRFLMPIGQVF